MLGACHQQRSWLWISPSDGTEWCKCINVNMLLQSVTTHPNLSFQWDGEKLNELRKKCLLKCVPLPSDLLSYFSISQLQIHRPPCYGSVLLTTYFNVFSDFSTFLKKSSILATSLLIYYMTRWNELHGSSTLWHSNSTFRHHIHSATSQQSEPWKPLTTT